MHDAHIVLLTALARAYGADEHFAVGVAEVVMKRYGTAIPNKALGEAIVADVEALVKERVDA